MDSGDRQTEETMEKEGKKGTRGMHSHAVSCVLDRFRIARQ